MLADRALPDMRGPALPGGHSRGLGAGPYFRGGFFIFYDMGIDYGGITRFIITTAPGDEQIALNEISRLNAGAAYNRRLGGGAVLLDLSADCGDLLNKINNDPPVFIRHIAPVHFAADPGDVDTLAARILTIADKDRTFAVQARSFDGKNERPGYPSQKRISAGLINGGCAPGGDNPAQIVSVSEVDGTVYAGVSYAADNLSKWPGGRAVYRPDLSRVSRSEFKLMEAADVFGLSFPAGGRALDLGASPGGWSRVLAAAGMLVTAVDPAALHASLTDDTRITHMRTTAGDYLRSNKPGQFDVIVNDMKMAPDLSIDVMIAAKPFLAENGFMVVTLKLHEKNKQKNAERAVKILKKHFHIAGARQLYNNRCEATVALARRGG